MHILQDVILKRNAIFQWFGHETAPKFLCELDELN